MQKSLLLVASTIVAVAGAHLASAQEKQERSPSTVNKDTAPKESGGAASKAEGANKADPKAEKGTSTQQANPSSGTSGSKPVQTGNTSGNTEQDSKKNADGDKGKAANQKAANDSDKSDPGKAGASKSGDDKSKAAQAGDVKAPNAAAKPTDDKTPTETKSKAEMDDKAKARDAASAPATAPNATTKSSDGTKAVPGGGGQAGIVTVTPEQRTKAVTIFSRNREQPELKIDFQVNVGTPVPRRVRLYAVPTEIIEFVPEYRRYRYFVVDERVVIVDPNSYEIIEVIVIKT